MAILKPKTTIKTVSRGFRLPADLAAELDALTTEAEAKGLVFDAREIVERALASAVRAARAELAVATPDDRPGLADHAD